MSRIEEALKKVANRRKSVATEVPVSLEPEVIETPLETSGTDKGRMSELLDVSPIAIDNLMLATTREEKTIVAEEYNKLRSAVIALTKGDAFLNTLMITSTVSDEGKSMTALNLAISLAKEYDHTVLLVDTDLRRPSIHKYLGIQPEVGLIHCLRDDLPIEQALIKTGIGKLVVLPAGEAVENPVNFLSSNRMKQIVRELKNRYDERYVIFDTPPALPFADAGILAGLVDSTLFVVREGCADKQELQKILEDFKEHHLLGVVYNDAHTFMKKQDYYY